MVSLMTTAVLCCFLTLSRPDFLFSDALAGVIANAVAANTTIDIIKDEALIENVNDKSTVIKDKLHNLNHSLITDIRCYGLMIAIQLDLDNTQFRKLMSNAEKQGLIILTTGINSTVRIL